MTESLCVALHGEVAGIAARGRAGAVSFEYDRSYRSGPAPTPLSIRVPLRAGRHEIDGWLDGLLPDNPAVRVRWCKDYTADSTRPMDLLATAVGRDCAGAVQFCPPEQLDKMRDRPSGATEIDDQTVARWLADLRRDSARWARAGAAGAFSLAGAQAKLALQHDDGTWRVPYGNTPTTHILKPPVPRFADSDIVEHVCLAAARRLGLRVADTEVLTVGGERTLVVTRYDRARGPGGAFVRVHQEDLCQALGVPPEMKYQMDGGPSPAQIAEVLRISATDPSADVRRFRDALIYSWLIAGTDAHAKNYSVLLDGPSVRLAPLYDVCSYLPYLEPGEPASHVLLAMKIGLDYSLSEADRRSAWERTAIALGLPADETVDRAADLASRVGEAMAEAVAELSPERQRSPQVKTLERAVALRARQCREALRG